MKRIIALALCTVFLFLFVSCDSQVINVTPPPSPNWTIEAPESTVGVTDVQTVTPEPTQDTQVGIIIPNQMSTAYNNVNVKSANAFVYDLTEGLQYHKGDMTAPIYPASVTKLYTARVALKYLNPMTVVKAGDELDLRMPDSSVAYISKGQKLTVSMLVEAMMLPSGNDAAYVLATAAGRKIRHDENCTPEEAIKTFMMAVNAQAYLDGMYHTHFSTPDGYHSDDHYTCLQDLIIIAKLALENETIMQYTNISKDKVHFVSGQSITWTNTNPLVNPSSSYYRKNVIGLKTGYTGKAGSCIIAAQKIGDSIVLVGIFGGKSSTQRNVDVTALLDLAAKQQK